jgi:hypothetical protein
LVKRWKRTTELELRLGEIKLRLREINFLRPMNSTGSVLVKLFCERERAKSLSRIKTNEPEIDFGSTKVILDFLLFLN